VQREQAVAQALGLVFGSALVGHRDFLGAQPCRREEALGLAGRQVLTEFLHEAGLRVSTHVDTARVATRNLKRYGIRACWFVQLGYPPEDWDDIIATRDLVREEAPDDIGVSVAYPLPGTVFHDRLAAELGAHRNWRDTGELAMLFEGTFDTVFYRMVRDALHADVTLRRNCEAGWTELAALAGAHRTGGAALRRSA